MTKFLHAILEVSKWVQATLKMGNIFSVLQDSKKSYIFAGENNTPYFLFCFLIQNNVYLVEINKFLDIHMIVHVQSLNKCHSHLVIEYGKSKRINIRIHSTKIEWNYFSLSFSRQEASLFHRFSFFKFYKIGLL